MSLQIQPRAIGFLVNHPHGVPVWQLAEHLGSSIGTTVQALRRMESRGEVVRVFHSEVVSNVVWATLSEATPPVFRAMETLHGMQQAAHQQFINQPMSEAA